MKVLSKLKLSRNEGLIILGILLVGFILRIYQLPQNFYYTMDEEVMNLIQRRIILGHHFPLIGSVSPLGTYLLPYFYFLGAFILFLSNSNPLGQGFFGVLLGLINIFLLFYIGREVFNKHIGIIASLFYSTSFLIVLFDRRWWHLSLGPFLSILVFYALIKIKKGQIKFIYLLLGALTLGWSTDYTNLVLFLYTFIAWILLKLQIKKREVGIAFVLFLVLNLPLVLFDLRHDFLNSKAFVSYLTKHKTETREGEALQGDRETLGSTKSDQAKIALTQPFVTFSRLFYVNSELDISKQQTYCKDYILDRNNSQGFILPSLAGVILLILLFITFKSKKEPSYLGYKLVSTFVVTFILGISFYGFMFKGDIFEHYMAALIPHLSLVTAVVLYYLFWEKRILLYLILFLIVGVNINLLTRSYNSLGFGYKMEAAKYALEKVGNSNFSLDSLGGCFKWDGYYYPFLLNNRHPVKSYQDPNYSWLFDYQVADIHPEKVVVFVSKGDHEDRIFEETYQKYQSLVIDRKKFGRLEVLILDNSKGGFN